MSFSPAGEANGAPPNPLAGFERPLRGRGKGGEKRSKGGGRKRWKKEKKRNKCLFTAQLCVL